MFTANGTIDLGDDVGFVKVKMGGVEKTIDLFRTSNALADLLEQHEGAGWLPAVAEYAVSLGYPGGLSLYAADRFAAAIFAKVKEMRGNESGGPSPASPASTEPQSSGTPASQEAPPS